jgi:cell division protein FtsN
MKPYLISIAFLGFLALASCKTTEENYHQAYERAIERKNNIGLDSVTSAMLQKEALPEVTTVNGESMPIKAEYVTETPDEKNGEQAHISKKYNVVAGKFKQVFTARSLQKRLIEIGYTDAAVYKNKESYYYTVASSWNTNEEALAGLKKLSEDKSITINSPFPWVLQNLFLSR